MKIKHLRQRLQYDISLRNSQCEERSKPRLGVTPIDHSWCQEEGENS